MSPHVFYDLVFLCLPALASLNTVAVQAYKATLCHFKTLMLSSWYRTTSLLLPFLREHGCLVLCSATLSSFFLSSSGSVFFQSLEPLPFLSKTETSELASCSQTRGDVVWSVSVWSVAAKEGMFLREGAKKASKVTQVHIGSARRVPFSALQVNKS